MKALRGALPPEERGPAGGQAVSEVGKGWEGAQHGSCLSRTKLLSKPWHWGTGGGGDAAAPQDPFTVCLS